MNALTPMPGVPTARDRAPSEQPPPYLLPRFDPAWLPEPMRWFAISHAKSLGVPFEMVALQALAVPALIAGPHIDVEARRGWLEPAMLYVLTIADSGTGKSPAMRPFSRLIRAVERARRESEKQRRDELVTELNKAMSAESAEEVVADAKKRLAELKSAGEPNPRLYATDERLATMMKDGEGAAGVWSAEPKFFRVAGGAYSNGGPATDVMLQAYSGDEVRVERQTKPPVYVDRPRLTIAMMSQRKPVEDFLDKTGHDERGELARFLMCSPPDWRGFMTLGPPVPEAHITLAEKCAQKLGGLYASPPSTVQLTDQARARFEVWGTEHQRMQRPMGVRREPKEWAAKMPGLVLRLAGVIHAAESIMEAETVARDLPLEVLERPSPSPNGASFRRVPSIGSPRRTPSLAASDASGPC